MNVGGGISNDDDGGTSMINEAVFTLEEVSDNDLRGSSSTWWSSTNTSHSKVRLCEANRQMIIENPPFKKFCFWNSGEPVTIPYHDILAVEVGFGSSDRHQQQNVEMELNSSSKKYKVFDSALSISLPTFAPNPALKFDDKVLVRYVHKNHNNVWSVRSFQLKHKNPDILYKWRVRLEHILEEIKNECQRPRRLLAFINPYGGKGEAIRLNSSIVQPLLNSCHVECHVIITERANHAQDYLLDCCLDGIDGVICIGGDGMFAELFNGLLFRSIKDKFNQDLVNDPNAEEWISSNDLPKPIVRIGVVPGGSTDAVAMSLHGTNDVTTATLHVILGDQRDVDVTSVCSGGRFQTFSLAMVSYGYFGDLLRRSEKYRWMGPKRYDVSGVRTFLGNKGYQGVISYVQSIRQDISDNDEHIHHQQEGIKDKCSKDCAICKDAKTIVETGDEKGYLMAKALKGKFTVITGACNKVASRFTPQGLAPGAHLGDGLVDLIVVNKTSRLNYFRYLYRSAYLNSSPYELPFVEHVKVREFRFIPDDKEKNLSNTGSARNNKTSVWNCDGEVLNTPEIHVKVHCQTLPVFARGPDH